VPAPFGKSGGGASKTVIPVYSVQLLIFQQVERRRFYFWYSFCFVIPKEIKRLALTIGGVLVNQGE
jgi:hypothetical protein